jgi:ring-1,2-phenylacetyl-CoA epoxidase subunit PaaE
MAVEFHRLKVSDVRRETPEAVSIAFAVPPHLAEAYRFRPGQHLTLRRGSGADEVRRSYSICTGVDDGELRIAVKRVEGGAFSCWANERVQAGDEIDVMTPQGRFGIAPETDAARQYLAIAAGSGITPVMSMVRSVLAGEPNSRFALIYGNRTSGSIIFKDALEDLKDRFLDRLEIHHVLSREQQELPLLTGRIDGEKIASVIRGLGGAPIVDEVFLCGPGGLIEEARAALARLGVVQQRIRVEYFSLEGTPVEPRPPRAAVSKREAPVAIAHLTLHGSKYEVPILAGETIVDAGVRAGLEMPYSCRGGMCCTCRAMLREGEVRMDQNYSLEPWELAAGYVLTCQSHPLTRKVVLDYDQV